MKVITIGRSKDNNNIVIEDSKVSRSHLQIINDDNGDYYVIDLDSTNGTFVNGNRITGKVQLHKGDIVVIGNTTLSWEAYFNSDDGDEDDNERVPSNKKLYIVIFSILICVFIGVIAIITYNNKKNEQYREASFDKVTKAYSEEANKARKKAEKEADVAKEKVANAEQEAAVANKKAEDAEKAKKNAEEQAKREVDTAKKQARVAEEAKKEAEESEQLTEEFYELLSSLKDVKIENVCDDVNIEGKDKEALKAHFKKANNEDKKKVIESIKDVKNMPEPTEEKQVQQSSGTIQASEQ